MQNLNYWLDGAINYSGRFTGYYTNSKGEEKKNAVTEPVNINWDKHFEGIETYGMSPVKIIQNGSGRKGVCRLCGFDLDIKAKPADVAKKLWCYNPELILFESSGGGYHVYYFFDDFVPVEDARKKATEIEKDLIKIFGKAVTGKRGGVDTGHTVPSSYNIEKMKPGYWLFQPYSPNKALKNKHSGRCLSARGRQLNKSQCVFRIQNRKNYIIAATVGAEDGEGGREPFLYKCALEIKFKNLDVTLDEVNQNFNAACDRIELQKHISSIEKSLNKDDVTEAEFEEKYEGYLYNILGFFRNEGKGERDLFEDLTVEEKDAADEILKNLIYLKVDDRWFNTNSYLKEGYKLKAVETEHGWIFGKGGWTKNYSKLEEDKKQMVEHGVYRPDLYDPNNLIIKSPEGLNYVNIYLPSKVEAFEPQNMQQQEELQMFINLVNNLTEKEGTGIDAKGREIPLNEYVLDTLSLNFQHPGVKNRSAVLIHSEEKQLGKGSLFETVRAALGHDNCTIITPENAIAREKSFIENQLVLIDEILIDGDYKKKVGVLNTLKPLMTNELHDCRPLFKDWRRVHSTCNYFLFTNHKNAIAIETNDARYTPIDVNKTREEMGGDEWFRNTYWKAFKQGTLINVVKHFLSTRTISSTFDPSSISLKTKFLKEMARAGGHPMFPECERLMKERSKPFDQSLLAFGDAFKYLKKEEGVKGHSTEFEKVLLKLGCIRVGEAKHKRSRKKVTLYITRNQDFFLDKSKAQMVNDYWLPTDYHLHDKGQFQFTPGEIDIVLRSQKEIDAYEDFLENNNDGVLIEDNENIEFAEILKVRNKSTLGDINDA